MEYANHSHDMGQELGYEGVERLVDQVEAVCIHERQRIDLTNEPDIVRLRMELAMWSDEEKRISEKLRLAPPGDRRARRTEAWLSLGFALVLTVAGFFFSLLAFDPFRLGWKSYLYCSGIALVCSYGVHKCLKEWDYRQLIRTLATCAGIAALTSLVLLAVIRGSLFVHEIEQNDTQAVVIEDTVAQPQDGTNFYQETLPLLQLAMAFLALAMELEAGLALHDAQRLGMGAGENPEKIAQERTTARMQMAITASQIVERSNEGAVFEAGFWRDFYRSMLTHTARKALGKLLAIGLAVMLVGASAAYAQTPPLNLVIAIDLSASVATKGPDGKTDFEKNVAAVSTLLADVPAGSRITVIGITGDSFVEPDILLSAQIGADPGYFGEKLAAAHWQLAAAWQERVAHIAPTAKRTDILGALLVAAQLFREAPEDGKKVLVIYSDMCQDTPKLSLEHASIPDTKSALIKVGEEKPDLKGVDVYALGVDAAGQAAAYWEKLRRFWIAYFQTAGAQVGGYSVLRNTPTL